VYDQGLDDDYTSIQQAIKVYLVITDVQGCGGLSGKIWNAVNLPERLKRDFTQFSTAVLLVVVLTKSVAFDTFIPH
jgi:hypothetical protein